MFQGEIRLNTLLTKYQHRYIVWSSIESDGLIASPRFAFLNIFIA
jgi:hypothetical protein